MIFSKISDSLCCRDQWEQIRICAYGDHGLRVQATKNSAFSKDDYAFEGAPRKENPAISITDSEATISNGKLTCKVSAGGYISFYRGDTLLLKEYSRCENGANDHAASLRIYPRQYHPNGSDYKIHVKFEAQPEKIYGMGQYQQPELDLKGCVLELKQRNSQITIPFYLSSAGYGFLWNHPGCGQVVFGKNYTDWTAECADGIDYYVTCGDTPKEILENYTGVVGRAPAMPEDVLGFWQCKLRYRTQEELLQVAREYKRRSIPLDVIVIDYFHWIHQGDYFFDPQYWPDVPAMVRELKEMGIRLMVSVWPTVSRDSVNFRKFYEQGYLLDYNYACGDERRIKHTLFFDVTNPQAAGPFWEAITAGYGKYGISLFWLDAAEPELDHHDPENYRCYAGPMAKVGNLYPLMYTKLFYDNLTAEGQQPVNLVRSAWVGSQKYGALVWSGDIKSNFASLRDQFAAGLHMGIAGIPWWTTDTGGFQGGNIHDENFHELLIRWFQYSTFCPILRLHGDRQPHDIPPLDSRIGYGGGYSRTGSPNELWSYSETVYEILQKYIQIRVNLKAYLSGLMKEASEKGYPVIRTMFFEFPGDKTCYEIEDQYMFGDRYLVAPVLYQGMHQRQVYLPEGVWTDFLTGKQYTGKQTITVQTPLDYIPVFYR